MRVSTSMALDAKNTFGQRRSSFGSSGEVSSEGRKVSELNGTLRTVKREEIGGMRLEWVKTERPYTGELRNWRELPALGCVPE